MQRMLSEDLSRLEQSFSSASSQNGASDNKLCWQGAGLGVEIADFGLN